MSARYLTTTSLAALSPSDRVGVGEVVDAMTAGVGDETLGEGVHPARTAAARTRGTAKRGTRHVSKVSSSRRRDVSTPRRCWNDARRRGGSCVGAFLAPARHPAQPTL